MRWCSDLAARRGWVSSRSWQLHCNNLKNSRHAVRESLNRETLKSIPSSLALRRTISTGSRQLDGTLQCSRWRMMATDLRTSGRTSFLRHLDPQWQTRSRQSKYHALSQAPVEHSRSRGLRPPLCLAFMRAVIDQAIHSS
jgi:hypothetical protein